jgi:hypothetical protein
MKLGPGLTLNKQAITVRLKSTDDVLTRRYAGGFNYRPDWLVQVAARFGRLVINGAEQLRLSLRALASTSPRIPQGTQWPKQYWEFARF